MGSMEEKEKPMVQFFYLLACDTAMGRMKSQSHYQGYMKRMQPSQASGAIESKAATAHNQMASHTITCHRNDATQISFHRFNELLKCKASFACSKT
jgi:GTP cyclohydrolase FolE2